MDNSDIKSGLKRSYFGTIDGVSISRINRHTAHIL